MKRHAQHRGLTLIEITIVVAIIAMLVGFGAPAVRALLNSFQDEDAVRSMVTAALETARAHALSESEDVGVRFQKTFNPTDWNDPNNTYDPYAAPQYMILVIRDPDATNYVRGFRALVGHKPMKLPERFGVMDLHLTSGTQIKTATDNVTRETLIDTTTFTVVFDKQGRVIRQPAYVRAFDGDDQLFNTEARFAQLGGPDPAFLVDVDTNASTTTNGEAGRVELYLYQQEKFLQGLRGQTAGTWNDYLPDLGSNPFYVAPRGGGLLNAGGNQ